MILEKGFEVNYTKMYHDHCFHCEQSGGACGFSLDSGFMCFCKGWDSHFDCRESEEWVYYRCSSLKHRAFIMDAILIIWFSKIVFTGDVQPYPPPNTNKENKKGEFTKLDAQKLKLIHKIAIAGACLFILVALIVGLIYLEKRKFHSQTLLSSIASCCCMRSDLEFGNGIPVFSYTKLQEATNNFDEARKLGHGGFGVVYHGKLRDGREVAVKRLFERDYKGVEQFRNEVEILTTLKHPNLVTLYGCTSRHSRELLLVYEYIPNGTVADHLYGDRSESGSLTWSIRMKIAIQTAGALSYLHATDIIHRDVKTNNILLDDNFSVKVADFGISRLFPFDATHVSTAPQGAPGYLDPLYFKCYQVTNKSDVYSFGVVLIQLISSLRAIDLSRDEDEIDLSTYAMNKIQHGKLCELVDQRLGFASDFKALPVFLGPVLFPCFIENLPLK
ncbi:hypothetical protein Cgig2_019706 [Carnegiea gigantea]|uniref:Protein kinase domain-containing protein n=1 Tax=Carnegiea gigantea TaxID=171969 RepID=A0A9Q1KPK7_9CARY|nr:hypothetical protein Cgig2_019706 [Carnegiea gigantea]